MYFPCVFTAKLSQVSLFVYCITSPVPPYVISILPTMFILISPKLVLFCLLLALFFRLSRFTYSTSKCNM